MSIGSVNAPDQHFLTFFFQIHKFSASIFFEKQTTSVLTLLRYPNVQDFIHEAQESVVRFLFGGKSNDKTISALKTIFEF